MRILLSGICGYMGKQVLALSEDAASEFTVAAGVDKAPAFGMSVPVFPSFDKAEGDFDCIIDFSHHTATRDLVSFAVKRGIPCVIATTGQTPEERAEIEEASKKIPVFFAANFSIGVALLCEIAAKTAAVMKDAEIEIVEIHHDRKADAPSGTAIALAEAIKKERPEMKTVAGRSGQAKRGADEIGISSVRIGNVVGIHEVLIGTKNETITLKHEAHDRALFASGAAAAAKFVAEQKPGLYGMKDMIGL